MKSPEYQPTRRIERRGLAALGLGLSVGLATILGNRFSKDGIPSNLSMPDMLARSTPTPTIVQPTPTFHPETNIWAVGKRSTDTIQVCVGTPKEKTLIIGTVKDNEGLMAQVIRAGYPDSKHADWSITGFKQAYENSTCPKE